MEGAISNPFAECLLFTNKQQLQHLNKLKHVNIEINT